MNKRLEKVKLNPVRYYSRLIKDDPQGIDLTMGEGHFNSPFNAKLKAYEALIKNETKYTRIEGDENLRQKIIEKYYPRYQKENIIITNGVTQAVFSVLLSIISSCEDEIIIIAPYYPAYLQTVNLLGGKPVIINSKENEFKISVNLLKQHVTNNTKAIIINEPNNPTGITYTKEEKEELLAFFQKHDYLVIVDEIYKLFTDDAFIPFTDLIDEPLKKRFVFINGLSKSHLMTGYRIGFVVGSRNMIEQIIKINYISVSCIATIMQKGAIGALEEEQYTQFVRRYYLNNLKIVCDTLDCLKINYVKPTCGYYVFMNIGEFQINSEAFCAYLSKNYHIALVPGKLFGETYDDYVRISCCKDIKDIIQFVNYLTDFIESYHDKKEYFFYQST